MSKGVPAVFENRWRHLRKCWKRVPPGYSKDDVHELRVAVRRFLSVMDVCRHLRKRLDPRKCRRFLKKVLKLSGPLRDLQMERSWIAPWIRDTPDLKDFDAASSVREKKALRDFNKVFNEDPVFLKQASQSSPPIYGARPERSRIEPQACSQFF